MSPEFSHIRDSNALKFVALVVGQQVARSCLSPDCNLMGVQIDGHKLMPFVTGPLDSSDGPIDVEFEAIPNCPNDGCVYDDNPDAVEPFLRYAILLSERADECLKG